MMQAAIRCCNDPSTCISGGDSSAVPVAQSDGGIQSNCQQMQNAGVSGSGANSSAAKACIEKYGDCMSTCGNMASTYAGQSIASTMRANARTCSGLSSKASELSAQSQNNLDAARAGQNCNQMSSALPQNLGGAFGDSGGSDTPQAVDPATCAQNPALAGCQAAAQAANAIAPPADGELAQFQSSTASDPTFAMPEQTGLDQPAFSGEGIVAAEAPKVNTIANNSGGGIPGAGGDSGGGGAQLGGGAARPSGGAGTTTSSTDIDQGFRSGGYAAAAAGLIDMPSESGGRAYGGGAGGGRAPAGLQGLDLKQYLPGGRLAGPQAGGLRTRSLEINGPYTNIWESVSRRYQEKCRLGELYDCR
jgi:hypothetical protein